MRILFFDIEIFTNYFLVVVYDPYTKEYTLFQLWEVDGKVIINDLHRLLKFLESEKDSYFCGYNSLGYDMNILTAIVKEKFTTNQQIKEFNDFLIGSEWSIYREQDLCNKTLDLMLVNNYGPRSAKSTSLKKLEFNLRKKKIQDLPYHFNDILTKEIQIADVIKYCKYDVEVTLDVFNFSKELINMRIEFGKLNNLDLLNSTEPDIAKKYMLKLLSQKLNKSEKEISKLKTYNNKLVVKDLILDYITDYSFKNKEFIDLLKFYESVELDATVKSAINPNIKVITLKSKIEHSFNFIKNKFVFAAGGGHSCQDPGVFISDNEYIIIDSDVQALYPSLAIENEFYPAQLGISYCEILKENVERRKKYSKKEFPLINNSIKVSNNASYGMSNSEYSFFYDSAYTLKTCVAGMLTLAMLIDMCVDEIKDFSLLQFNTDGITIRIKKTDQDLYFSLIKRLEDISKLVFEHVYYKKMIIRDVKFAS